MRAISVAFHAYLSSRVGESGMGLITLCSGVYGFAITFACSGINLAITRLISADIATGGKCSKKIMRSAFAYCLFFSLISSIALFFSANFIGCTLLNDARAVPSIKLFSFSLVPISISSALNGYFCAVRRVYKNVIAQFLEQGVRISAVSYLILILAPYGLEFSCVAVIGGGVISEFSCFLISFILYLFDSKKHLPYQASTADEGSIGKIGEIALPVAISAYVRSALSTIEHLAIPWGLRRCGLDYDTSLASYGILCGMVIPLLLFPSAVLGAFSSLLVPELSSSKEIGNTKRIKYIVSKVFAVSLIFSLGVSGIFISFSYELGYFLYGSVEAGEYIRLLAPLIPLMYLDGAVDAMLKGLGEQLYTMRVNITDSAVSVLLILILLPSLGISGYVAVIFITELFNTSLSIIKLLDVTDIKTPVIKWILKPLITVILSTLAVRLLVDFNIFTNLFGVVPYGKSFVFFEIGLSAIFYVLISVIIGAISKDDIDLAKRLVKS